MLKEARTIRLKILPERQKRTQQGILVDDVDFDEFDLSKYDRKMNINNSDNPDKATQTDFNLASSSHSSVSESMRTPEEAVKEEVSEASSIRSREKSVERGTTKQKGKQNERSLMRRMFDSMFGNDEYEEGREELRRMRDASDEASPANREQREQREEDEENLERVATEESQASSSSLPMNVKKSYELYSSSSVRRSSGRSALLPVEEGALSEYVQSSRDSSRGPDERPPETVQSSVPSDATVEYLQSSPPVSVASSERTIDYIRSRSSSGRSR